MATLYCFVDESGNLDFSPHGTKFYVLTLLSTTNPNEIATALSRLRYTLLPTSLVDTAYEEEGYFHATEDQQALRDQVFATLVSLRQHIRVDAVIAQKNKTHPRLQKEKEFYEALGRPLLRFAFNRAYAQGFNRVVIVFSNVLTKKLQGVLKQTFKRLIKSEGKVPFELYFHPCRADMCNQAADYFGWAVYRKCENGDVRSYNLVKSLVESEFDLFTRGTTEYYVYK